MRRMNARELRTFVPDKQIISRLKRQPIFLVLDNVLDTYNTGSIFRLADAVAVEKIFLCGETESPPNPRIKKASINTWQWVKWEYCSDTQSVLKLLRKKYKKLEIVCLEQDKRSKSIYDYIPRFPLALVVGNETYGISEKVLKYADTIVELPMFGVNKSLNVMVSCGIFLYHTLGFMR